MNFFSAISGQMIIVDAAKLAHEIGYRISSADGDLCCYIVTPINVSNICCINEFRKRQRHTLGMIHASGAIIVGD